MSEKLSEFVFPYFLKEGDEILIRFSRLFEPDIKRVYLEAISLENPLRRYDIQVEIPLSIPDYNEKIILYELIYHLVNVYDTNPQDYLKYTPYMEISLYDALEELKDKLKEPILKTAIDEACKEIDMEYVVRKAIEKSKYCEFIDKDTIKCYGYTYKIKKTSFNEVILERI